jgi:hypothetical protein
MRMMTRYIINIIGESFVVRKFKTDSPILIDCCFKTIPTGTEKLYHLYGSGQSGIFGLQYQVVSKQPNFHHISL